MNAPRKKAASSRRNRYIGGIVLLSSFVIGLAAFTGALRELYKFATGLIPQKQVAAFTVVDRPIELPKEIKIFKEQASHRVDCPPTMDQAALDLPAFDRDSEVWLEATCTADCFSDQSFVGVRILCNGKTFVERESQQGRGMITASAFAKILVRAGNPLQFEIDGADHLAKRKAVTFTAYSSALP
jgi:hypothetical protein